MGDWADIFIETDLFLRKWGDSLDRTALREKHQWEKVLENYVTEALDTLNQTLTTLFGPNLRWIIFSYWSPFYEEKLHTKPKINVASTNAQEVSSWYNNLLSSKEGWTSLALYELLCHLSKNEKPAASVCISKQESHHPGAVVNISSFIGALKKTRVSQQATYWDIGSSLLKNETNRDSFYKIFTDRIYSPLCSLIKSNSAGGEEIRNSIESFRQQYAQAFGKNSEAKKDRIQEASYEHLLVILLLCAFFDLKEDVRIIGYSSALPPGTNSSGIFFSLDRDLTTSENAILQAVVNNICWFPTLIENVGIQEKHTWSAIYNATHAGKTGLSGRNLSHHLGSHILHWLELDAREQARLFKSMAASDGDHKAHFLWLVQYFKSKALFYSYLRERMDLVAGMAVYLPHWTTTMTVAGVLEGLEPSEASDTNSLVLRHIGQSEGVYHVDLLSSDSSLAQQVAIPGSAMGRQAFYGILENVVRDGAKYGDIQSNAVAVIRNLTGNNKWVEHKLPEQFVTCYHFDSNYPDVDELKRKFSGYDGRILIVHIAESSDTCTASRQLWQEAKLSNPKFLMWQLKIVNNCRHRLCQVIRELTEKLGQNDSGGVCEKASELDRALLSIVIEISELNDSDLTVSNGESEHLNQQAKQDAIDNFYRVVVYDDRSSFSENSRQVTEAIETLEREGLCDESGRLRSGDWGIKERYIFATYLRGEKPEDWLLSETIRNKKSAVPPILRIENYSDKLAWVFYTFKPKDILVVSDIHGPESLTLESKKRINIWDWNILQERLTSFSLRHKFVILCPNNKGQMQKIDRILSYLPYRVFLCHHAKDEVPSPIAQYCALLDRDTLDLSSLDVRTLYGNWIKFVSAHRGRPIPSVLAVAGSSTEGARGFNGDWIKGQNSAKNWIAQEGNERVALFDRHGLFAGTVSENQQRRFLHYEPFQGGWPVERRADFVKGPQHLRDDYSFLKTPLQEAAMIRILVIDERIDGSLGRIKERFNKIEFTFRGIWELKGVDLMGQQYKGKGREVPDEKPILQRVEEAKSQGRPYDFVLVHQGILDKVYDKLPKTKKETERKQSFVEKVIEQIRERGSVWHVIVHSGRGGIPELPEGTKFIHLSSVEAWFGTNQSKADVVDELMSVRRQES